MFICSESATAWPAVGACHARQQRHCAQRLATTGKPLHALAEANERGLGPSVEGREALNVGLGEAGDLSHSGWHKAGQNVGLEPVEAHSVVGDVVFIAQPVAHQDMHEAEGQRCIRADADGNVPIGTLVFDVELVSVARIHVSEIEL